MKRLLYLAVVLLVASCGKEQSSYTVGSIKDQATITGTLYYNEGDVATTIDNKNAIIENNKVIAAGQKVLVTVAYSEYSTGASGNKIYEAKVDDDGSYSIDIPVVDVISVEVSCMPFTADYNYKFNDAIITIPDAIYDATSQTLSLSPYSIERVDLVANTTDTYSAETITLPVTVSGVIYSRSESITLNGSVYSIGSSPVNKEMANAAAYLEIYSSSDNRVIKYAVTSDSNGEFTFNALFFSDWDYNNVAVTMCMESDYSVSSTDVHAFSHYYFDVGDYTKYSTQKLSGYYSEYSSTSAGLSTIMANGDLVPEVSLTLDFTPYYKSDVIGVYANTGLYYSPNPMFW